MRLYDDAIERLLDSLKGYDSRVLGLGETWPDAGDHNLLLRSDMAYELGGGNEAAVGAMAVTCSSELVPADQVLLIGPDLPELSADTSYARISLIRVREDSLGDGNALYNSIKKLEYVRYHVSPEGYMTRISTASSREPVRVGRQALSQGLDFARVGRLFIDKYHENKNVEAVGIIFVTLPGVDYKSLAGQARALEDITATIDHIFKNVIMDCGSCSLQQVCDEVEGLRELHFAAQGETTKERKGV